MYKINIIKDSTEIRKLIAANPDLPMVVIGEDLDSAWYELGYLYQSCTIAYVSDILDCMCDWQDIIDYVYDDRAVFDDDLIEYLSRKEEYSKLSDEEFKKIVELEKQKYEPYWHKAIVIVINPPDVKLEGYAEYIKTQKKEKKVYEKRN